MNSILKIKLFGAFVPTLALISALYLSSCGSAEEEGGAKKIETKDVKGTIDPGEGSLENLNYNLNGKDMQVAKVEFEGAEFIIVPTTDDFAVHWQALESNLSAFGSFEIIKKEDNAVFYKEMKDFAGKKEEGYGFLVWAKGGETNYYIKSEGENPLAPILDKEVAEKAFNAAKTFKAE